MCMNVDLPEPDGPVTARNSPRGTSMIDAAQRLHLVIADDVGLDQAAAEMTRRALCRAVCARQ